MIRVIDEPRANAVQMPATGQGAIIAILPGDQHEQKVLLSPRAARRLIVALTAAVLHAEGIDGSG